MRDTIKSIALASTAAIAIPLVPAPAAAQQESTVEEIAPGVVHETYTYKGQPVNQLSVSIVEDHISADVLVPDSIAHTEKPSLMAEQAEATAVVNGDFFNNSEDDWPRYTDAPVGPMITDNADLFPSLSFTGQTYVKGAVPGKQRMGPGRPEGSPNESALAFQDGQPIMTEFHVQGTIDTNRGNHVLEGVNQYGLAHDSIGYFDSGWGATDRYRAVCGDYDDRTKPCSENIHDVLVRDGVVVGIDDIVPPVEPGAYTPFEHYRNIRDNEFILLARDDAADWLRTLEPGDEVTPNWSLDSPDGPVDTAIGGMPIVRDGALVPGLPEADYDDGELDQPKNAAVRTAVGYNAGANVLYMVTVGETDGRGVTLRELGDLMIDLGAVDALNFDGGGSTMMGTATDDGSIEVRNDPTDFFGERSVANALAIFATDERVSYMEGRWKLQNGSPFAPSLLVDERGATRYIGHNSSEFFGPLKVSSASSAAQWEMSADFQEYSYLDDTISDGFTFTLNVETDSPNLTPQPGDQFVDSDGNVWERQEEEQ